MWTERGPSYEELEIGWAFESERFTLTTGHAAWFLAFGGDQNGTHLRPGRSGDPVPVNTALVAHLAIGQSTAATREVVANLFYRDVVFWAPVFPGTTLRATVSVVDRSMARARPDRPPRGKVMLHIVMRDDADRVVLSMYRCALMSASTVADESAGRELTTEAGTDDLGSALASWSPMVSTDSAAEIGWIPGVERHDHLAEPVVDALGLVRLTGNEARAHRDPAYGQASRRLVYGGHTLSLAQSALSRLLSVPHAVITWRSCDHPAPVFEEDLLNTAATLVGQSPIGAEQLLTLDVVTTARAADGEERLVQRWQPQVLVAGSGHRPD